MKSNEQLRKEFEEQTGNKAIVFPACHGETGYASWEYQLWLEQKLLEEYAQQSQPSGMWWVDDVNKIRGQAKAFGDKYSGSISEQAAAEVGFNAAINQVINILSEPSPAGAAEGASEGISKIREVMNWISQCVDEDHDLEVSEIKMIWNDLSDAISLIESTPHSSEGMAEAWVIEYDNDTGPGDEYFVEWFNVTNGEKSFRCNSKEDAEFLLASLSPGVEDNQTKKQ
jgi:hypothetical protein